jgi:hypothetical protein
MVGNSGNTVVHKIEAWVRTDNVYPVQLPLYIDTIHNGTEVNRSQIYQFTQWDIARDITIPTVSLFDMQGKRTYPDVQTLSDLREE